MDSHREDTAVDPAFAFFLPRSTYLRYLCVPFLTEHECFPGTSVLQSSACREVLSNIRSAYNERPMRGALISICF